MEISQKEDINILIVDDNPDILWALESSLERDGLNIFTTTTPNNVLQTCIDKKVCIALIDVKMPEISGFELLESIKKNLLTERIIVVLITGYSMNSEDVVKGLNMGAVDFLFKPLDLYITIAKIKSLITLVNYQREIKKKNIELENFQKELYSALEQTQKSQEAKEIFLANMSHEIRTPLTAIIGLNHLLKKTPINKDQQEMINLMEHSSKSLLGLVNDILDSAKIDAGKITITQSETNVVKLVQTTCNLIKPMANEKGLQLTCNICKDIPTSIMSDSLRLNQILMNLISNSIKFTQAGSINVSLRALERAQNKVLLEFTISDTGIGIPEFAINKMFQRFEQADDKTWRKFGGTGLGLSIVKRLIELMGGYIEVESTLGQGTTFTFTNWYIFKDEVKTPDTIQAKKAPLTKLDNIKILLAEDNVINQYVTVKILKEWNVNVDVVDNGLEAFEKLKYNNYNLILMDTHMPVMDGHEATKKIRKEMTDSRKNIPIISFSASVTENELDEAKRAGADDVITKPFEPLTLHGKIVSLLERKKSE